VRSLLPPLGPGNHEVDPTPLPGEWLQMAVPANPGGSELAQIKAAIIPSRLLILIARDNQNPATIWWTRYDISNGAAGWSAPTPGSQQTPPTWAAVVVGQPAVPPEVSTIQDFDLVWTVNYGLVMAYIDTTLSTYPIIFDGQSITTYSHQRFTKTAVSIPLLRTNQIFRRFHTASTHSGRWTAPVFLCTDSTGGQIGAKPNGSSRLGVYVRRWVGWAKGGLPSGRTDTETGRDTRPRPPAAKAAGATTIMPQSLVPSPEA
jgi:hypothetical protein